MIVDASTWTARPREVGILFRGEMVRAILADKKDVTRRMECRAHPGDVLWVRETWTPAGLEGSLIAFRADYVDAKYSFAWKPGIHLRRADARIFLHVESVTDGRWITDEDARREGVSSAAEFVSLWDEINGKRTVNGLSCGPWPPKAPVVRVEFSRIVNYPWAGCGPREKPVAPEMRPWADYHAGRKHWGMP